MLQILRDARDVINGISFLGEINLVLVFLFYIWLLIVVVNNGTFKAKFLNISDYRKVLFFSIALALSIRIAVVNSLDDRALKLIFLPRFMFVALLDAALIFLGIRILFRLPRFSGTLVFITWVLFCGYLFFVLGKSKHLGYLIVARDFSIAKNIGVITPGFYFFKLLQDKMPQFIIGFVLPFIVGSILFFKLKKSVFYRPTRWVKQELIGISLYILLVLLFCNNIAHQYYHQYVNKGNLSVSEAVSIMGLYEAQSSIYSPSYNKRPKNYESKITKLTNDIKSKYPAKAATDSKKPDIMIYFANESFFRADRLFKSLRTNDVNDKVFSSYNGLIEDGAIHGPLSVAPLFGAGTNDSEFFVQSGLVSHSITKFFKKEIPSIISYYKDLGYTTVYAHIVVDEFFNYDDVTKKLGFDEIYLGSYFNEDWGNDAKLYAKMQERILEAEKNNEKLMLFFIDLGRHSPYVELEAINEKWKVDDSQLASYIEKSSNSNKMIGKFIDFLKDRTEEIGLLVFGDHQPPLEQLKLLGELRLTTDFYIWSNKSPLNYMYDMKNKKNFASPKLHALMAYAFGFPIRPIDSYYLQTDNDMLNDINIPLLCYDILIGKQYSRELFEISK